MGTGSEVGADGGRAQLAPAALQWSLGRFGLLAAAVGVMALGWLAPPLYALLALGALLAVALTLRYPVAGFCLLAFSVPWASGFSLPLGSFPITLTDLLVAALGAAWLARSFSVRRNPVTTWVWTPYLAIFLAAIGLSALQAADVHASLREIVKWFELGVVFLAGASLLGGRRDVRVLVAAVVAAGVSQALLGYVQFAFSLGPAAFAAQRLFLRAYGTFDQPNPYAGYLNMVLPLAIAMGALAPGRRERVAYRLSGALVAGALLASESRGALLAGLLATAVVILCLAPRLLSLGWAAVVAGLGGAWLATYNLIPVGPVQRVLAAIGLGNVSFEHVTDANFSAVERAAHWLAGVRMFAAHPLLGVGIGNYATAYPAYHPRGWYASLEHAHNYYINIAAEAGIVGLAAYLLLAGSALWYSYATMRQARDGLYRAAVLGVIGALIATNFHNLFDVLYVHGMVVLLGLLMVLLPVSARAGREHWGGAESA